MFKTSSTTSIKQAYVPAAGVLRPFYVFGCCSAASHSHLLWRLKKFQVSVDEAPCVSPLMSCACSAVSGVHFEPTSYTQVGGRKKKNHQHNINIIESFWEAYLSCGWNCTVESQPVHHNPPTPNSTSLYSLFFCFLSFPSTSGQVLICQEYYRPEPSVVGEVAAYCGPAVIWLAHGRCDGA